MNMNKIDLSVIFVKGVAAVQPQLLIQNSVRIENHHLIFNNTGASYRVAGPCKCYIVGFGKAVYGMAVELEKLLDDHLCKGIVTVPVGIFDALQKIPVPPPKLQSRLRFIEGAKNNLPDMSAYNGALEIKQLVSGLKEEDILIVLISGGGSALLPLPASPITLVEKLCMIKALSRAGANIIELNTVRKKLSAVKGGRLALLAKPAKVISLILSDVIGDPIDFIASGPTVHNTDKVDDALKIVKKYKLFDKAPNSIRDILMKTCKCEAPKQFEHVLNVVIGNNKLAAEASAEEARKLGYQTVILTTCIESDVEDLSKWYAQLAELIVTGNQVGVKKFLQEAQAAGLYDIPVEEVVNLNLNSPICIVSAGEPTVVVRGKGKGGRNQELALRFSLEVSKLNVKTANILFLCMATDGIDGPTDAAGALGSSNLVNDAKAQNINPHCFLNNNDSYNFYSKFNGGEYLYKTDHSGTNVMDLHIMTIKPHHGRH